MRPVTVSQTGAGATDPVPLNQYAPTFNVSLFCKVEGTAEYTVQYTSDDIWDPSVTPDWTDHSSLTELSADADAVIASPVSAVRLVQNSGAGTTTLIVRQAGIA